MYDLWVAFLATLPTASDLSVSVLLMSSVSVLTLKTPEKYLAMAAVARIQYKRHVHRGQSRRGTLSLPLLSLQLPACCCATGRLSTKCRYSAPVNNLHRLSRDLLLLGLGVDDGRRVGGRK